MTRSWAASVGHWLADLQRRPRVTRLRVARLAAGEVAELVAGLVPAGAGPDPVAAVVGAAGGNPLYAMELADAGAHWPPPRSPRRCWPRPRVSPRGQAVVDQVCVADGGMSHELLAAAVPLAEKRLLASARRAVVTGLLVPAGDGYAFGHALIRQVLYAQLLPGERRHLHHRLAEALAARPDSDPGLLAQHWHLAGHRTGPGPPPCWRRARRSRNAPTRRPSALHARRRTGAVAARGGSGPAGGGGAGRGLGGGSRPRRRVDR